MRKKSIIQSEAGLTLIELMSTVLILAVTVVLAAPTMRGTIQSNQLETETTRFLDAFSLARSEAILRNTPVSLCPSAMARTGLASCAGTFDQGWILFTNHGRNNTYTPATDELLQVFSPVPVGLRLTNSAGNQTVGGIITFLPDGSSRRNLSLLFCAEGGPALASQRIVLNAVGRARSIKGDAQCS
ncbi:MAG: GspH/FimT family pseudopilin [Pseudomonadota bacterium]